ncbi:hypothetical protein Leryth_011564 [Lithospermum erythrorhizon]|nr:hypothetical protein Leryth_011564 [Lithospermum erythrorhizon]
MEEINEIRRNSFAVPDREIQGSSTTQVVEKMKSAHVSKNEISSVKPESVQSREMQQLNSEKPVKLERNRRRTKAHDVYIDIEAKFSVIERAYRVLRSLTNEFPYFQKCMLASNVCHSFWMIFPTGFCKFLPNCDSTVTLVDESGVECETTYLFDRRGLSAGWRRFSISHKLLKGDILVFQLIDHCKFKVRIVRVYDVDVLDAASCLMHMVASSGTTYSDVGKKQEKRG